jgi:ABC-type antimicrobial peptide transport system permease subunit
MILRDQFRYAFGNLFKTRLRTTLTAAGVSIGIGAMTSMVSVGLGTQRTVMQAFNEGNILTSVLVLPTEESEDVSSVEIHPALDSASVQNFKDLPGVRDVYPLLTISGLLQFEDEELFRNLEGMPARMLAEQIDRGAVEVIAGRAYDDGEADVIVLSERAALTLARDSAELEALVGNTVVFNAARAPGLPNVEQLIQDSLPTQLPAEISALAPMLRSLPIAGVIGSMPMGLLEPVRLELTVVGVVKGGGNLSDFVGLSLWVPIAVVEPLHAQTFQNLEAILTGSAGSQGYPMVQVLTSDVMAVRPVQDSIETMGYQAQSILDEIDQVRRSFIFMNSLLGSIGGISLVVAAMMIVNTLVMAVWERTREIGLLKSMGATDGDVLRLFLTEAGVIGIFGGLGGLLLGYIVARITNALANIQFERVGEVSVDLVAFTPLLMMGGMVFAIVVSLTAGYYPARRAARVDPVVALRHF